MTKETMTATEPVDLAEQIAGVAAPQLVAMLGAVEAVVRAYKHKGHKLTTDEVGEVQRLAALVDQHAAEMSE
jgi:hypothetical protein